ncbi:MAG: hypothetical protein JWM33_2307 [Caulobacteraceae bacterium]|nr:hypothetical protein [Caulobacteraceae bacterium]
MTNLAQGRRPVETPEDLAAALGAARAGEPDAMRLAGLVAAAGLDGAPDWPAALDWAAAAAEAGDDESCGELLLMADDAIQREAIGHFSKGQSFPAGWWRRVASSLDLGRLLTPPPPQVVSTSPHIVTVEAMISPELAASLIDRATPFLERSTVLVPDMAAVVVEAGRTNSSASFGFSSTGLPLLALRQRIAALIDVSVDRLETTNILHYKPGQTFQPHFDGFPAGTRIAHSAYAAAGQRVATALVYLNTDYGGGETVFPRLSARFKGRCGQALMWRNVLPGGVEIDPATLHAGAPPTVGEKWVLSQWIREHPVPVFRQNPD